MLSRHLSTSFFLVGLGLLGVAAWGYFSAADEDPSVTVDDADREVAVGAPGQEVVVSFPIHNRSSRPVRVVGLAEC